MHKINDTKTIKYLNVNNQNIANLTFGFIVITQLSLHAHIYTQYTHMCTNTYVAMPVYMHTSDVNACTYTYEHTYTYAHTHTQLHTNIHTHTHMYTHTYVTRTGKTGLIYM